MRLVTLGGLILAVALPLSATAPGTPGADFALMSGLFLALFGALYWRALRRHGEWPLRREERAVVVSAVGMVVADLLLVLPQPMSFVGFALWWISVVAFAISLVRWALAARRGRGLVLPPDPLRSDGGAP